MSKKLKPGMSATLKSEFTGYRKNDRLDTYGYAKGETVTVVAYDPNDESWKVCKPGQESKHREHIFVKRSQLAPGAAVPQPTENNPFKVGDKVQLTNGKAQWAESDKVTTGKTYIVSAATKYDEHQKVPYIKVEGEGARGVYWIQSKYFALAQDKTEAEPHGWKVGDQLKADLLNDGNPRRYHGHSHDSGWTLKKERYFIDDRVIENIKTIEGVAAGLISGTRNIWVALHDLPKAEIEAEAPKVEEDGIVEMECVDNSGFAKWLTVGKTYKVHLNKRIAGTAKISGLDQPHKGGPDKDDSLYLYLDRFKEVTKAEGDTLVQFLTELEALIQKYK